MRCALLPGWFGIAVDEAMSQFDNMQADALTMTRDGAQGRGIMTRIPLLITLAAAAALAGCNKDDHTIVAGGDPADDTNVAANANVQLPPSISSSKSYRCADNRLIYVDWMSDGSARVKSKREEVGTPVAAGSPDLKGDAQASSISYKGQSCKA